MPAARQVPPSAHIVGFTFESPDNDAGRIDYMRRYNLDGVVDIRLIGVDCPIEHEHEPGCFITTLGIPFRHHSKGRDREKDGINVWLWDGDRDAPTLHPSYLTWWGNDPSDPFFMRFHCFIRRGELDLLGDSQVGRIPMVRV